MRDRCPHHHQCAAPESLNDIVGGVTGVRVRETVPDPVFDAADEIVLVDLTPDDLLDRLREGKVYLPAQAERAIEHFSAKAICWHCVNWRCGGPLTVSMNKCVPAGAEGQEKVWHTGCDSGLSASGRRQ